MVAMSLDGYIAGPNGEADWIVMDPEIDFGELWSQFDMGLMGRRTYEAAVARLGKAALQRMKIVVVSRTLRAEEHPDFTIISELDRPRIQALRAMATKDIWLFGGGELFASLMELGEVDAVEVSVMPVLLGGGVRLLPSSVWPMQLSLLTQRIYRASGIVSLIYDVPR